MRIESVTAHAFGPLREQRLDLAPGMTVVAGPNEAGKSSWHAALRAAICGIRRGRGRPTAEEQEFADLHRPWDTPEDWSVEARLQLERDGRTIEIRQDLGGRIASTAIELPLGRRVADEIMNEGSPDASLWLGLDRSAFARTICVDQGDLLAVTREAGLLQEYLQRAAATQGADATAAEALERLRRFRAEAVGLDRVGSVRPLRQAIVALDEARATLDRGRRDHEAYLALQAEADDARMDHERAATQLRLLEAAVAVRAAGRMAERAARARELADRHPHEPEGMPERDELADEVAAAVAAWQDRPAPPDLSGESSDEIRERIAALPPIPEGDREVHPAVASAYVAWRAAGGVLAQLGERPAVGPMPDTGGLSAAALDGLAADLEAAPPPPGFEDDRRLSDAARLRESLRRPLIAATAAGGALGLAAAWALLAGAVLPGVVLMVAAVALAVVAVRLGRRWAAAGVAEASATAEREPVRIAVAAADARRSEARSRIERAGLSPDPAALREVARALEAHDAAARAAADWDARRSRAMAQQVSAAESVRASLRARGAMADGDLAGAFAAYERACAECADAARRAEQGDALRAALASRLEAERGAREAAARIDEARDRLVAVVGRVGIDAAGLDEQRIVDGLQVWQRAQSEERAARQEELREWEELRVLLDGSTLEAFEARAAAERRRAAELVAGVDAAALAGIAVTDDDGGRLAALREAERASLTRARDLEGRRAERAASLADVAAAEEAVARAEEELARVRRLETTLETTARLLEGAQERVHRDLAPILADAVRPSLAVVTAGRYDDVAIDPASLAIQMKEEPGGLWRDARRLSQGTREQAYLLLRAAMAQHLVTTGEVAPLLLDEVTAQSDDVRRRAVLAALHELSRDRQVVLFTHDADVVAWARDALDPTRDRLVELAGPAG